MFSGSIKSLVVAAALVFGVAGCSETPGSGIATNQSRVVAAFDEIEIHGMDANIKVEAGAQSSLEISGDDNLVPRVITRVEGRRLVVDLDDRDIDPVRQLVVTFHVPEMKKIVAEQEAHVDITIDASSTLVVEGNSSGVIVAHGTIGRLDAELTGGARLVAHELKATDVILEATGGSNASVCVTGKLDVDLDGGADATYSCHPRDVDRDIDDDSDLDER